MEEIFFVNLQSKNLFFVHNDVNCTFAPEQILFEAKVNLPSLFVSIARFFVVIPCNLFENS